MSEQIIDNQELMNNFTKKDKSSDNSTLLQDLFIYTLKYDSMEFLKYLMTFFDNTYIAHLLPQLEKLCMIAIFYNRIETLKYLVSLFDKTSFSNFLMGLADQGMLKIYLEIINLNQIENPDKFYEELIKKDLDDYILSVPNLKYYNSIKHKFIFASECKAEKCFEKIRNFYPGHVLTFKNIQLRGYYVPFNICLYEPDPNDISINKEF